MSKEINFWFFVAVLRRCFVWCLLAMVVAGVVSGLVSKYFIRKEYSSAVSLYIGRSQDTKGDTDDYRTAARDLQIGLQLVEDYRELLNSRRIADKVRNLVELRYPDMPCGYSAKVEPVRQTRMINVTVTAGDPEVACKVANTMANVFIDEIQEILSIQNSQVIDSAEINPNPVSPRIFRNTVLGGAVAFLVVYGIFALKMLLDTKIRTPKDVEMELELPILGTIPMFKDFENLPDGDSGKDGTRIVSVQKDSDKRFESSEPFSNLRTNIQYSGARAMEDRSCRTLLVTSALSGEGKSFVSANMAASFADAGNHTLIVNCDLRRPALSWTLGAESKKGLVNILAGESTFDDAVVRNLFGLKLDALLCGPVPPNPSKLLLSSEFRDLLDVLKKKYDYIVIDAPPSFGMSDSAIVGAMCDGVLLVMQSGRVGAELARDVISQFKQVNLHVDGVVINRISAKTSGYGYGYGYGRGYGYGYGKYGYGYGKYGYGYGYGYGAGDGKKHHRSIWRRMYDSVRKLTGK